MVTPTDAEQDLELRRERRLTGFLLLGGVILAGAILFLVLLPARRDAASLISALYDINNRIRALQSVPAPSEPDEPSRFRLSFALNTVPVEPAATEWDIRLQNRKLKRQALADEWSTLRSKISTFGGEADLNQWLDAPEDARIDFKVSLFNARVRIEEASRRAGLTAPPSLGVSETISAEESAEIRLWQLATSVRFLEICIKAGVPRVESIQALAPFSRPAVPDDPFVQMVYPLSVRLRCSYKTFQDLIRLLDEPGGYFGLSNVMLTQDQPMQDDPIEISVTLQATVFRVPVKHPDPSESETPAETPEEPMP